MSRIKLYVPRLKDYWYEEKILSDPESMSYNAGWNVNYDGYDYETGCIEFKKDRWKDDFDKRKKKDKAFFYILNKDSNEFIGYITYYYSMGSNRYNVSLVIESIHRGHGYAKDALELLMKKAKKKGIKELYDSFEEGRAGSKVFYELGFEKINTYKERRFKKEINIIELRKKL